MVRALNRKLLRDLWIARGQALAIALVVAAGVAMFVLMFSTFDSLHLTQQQYYDRYRFGDVFASLTRAPLSLAPDLAAIPGVAEADTRVVADVALDVAGQAAPISGRLISYPDDGRPTLNDVFLSEGRLLDPRRDDEVLASETFARANGLVPGDTVGALVNGRRRDLRIVGLVLSPEYVYAIRPGELIADDARFGVLWMGRQALGAAFQMEGGFNDVSLRLTRGASVEDVIARLDRLLEPYGGLGAIPRALQLSHFFLQSEIDSLRGLGEIAPVVFLAVAAFLLNIVLARLVSVQREQIAALKAIGYTHVEIGAHVVKWSLIVGLAGGGIGLGAGAVLGRAMTVFYTNFFHFPILNYHLSASLVLTAIAVTAAASAAGAAGAVRRVVSLPPAEAMRPAAPAPYAVSWIERAGLRRWLSQPTRIILRNLQRHPARTALSTLGVAFGGALLVVGTFSVDAIAAVTDVQFNVAQVYDAVVTFVRPRSESAADEVARLPGVMRAEPFRAVPVRLRHGPRSRVLAITALPESSDLNRVVDAPPGAPPAIVALPADGLVLSAKLAQLLDVRDGDAITIDVLEGERIARTATVVRLVNDYMGTNAYMRLDAMHRLLQEGGSVSGAYLQVDASAAGALYRQLRLTPAVAGVSLRRAMLDSFNTTLAESIRITRGVTVAFAAIIAFGVIYSTTRIALSERSRELATLRVIGFTRGEIAYILLGELAVITAASLPVGWILGYGLASATVGAFSTEVYRIPLVVSRQTYAVAGLTTLTTAALSAIIVRRLLDRLDLIGVLKTRE